MSLKIHRTLTPNRSTSQNTPKSGGTKTALTVLTDTTNQATLNTGRNSNRSYAQSRGNSLMTRSTKLHHLTRNPGVKYRGGTGAE